MRTEAQLNLIRALCTHQDEKVAFIGHAFRFGGKALLGAGKLGFRAARAGLPAAARAAGKAGGFAWRHPWGTAGTALTGGFFASDLMKAFNKSSPVRGRVQTRNLASGIPGPR